MAAGPDPLYKVVLVGEVGVGKTSVYTRHQKGFFNPLRTSTLCVDNFTDEMVLDGNRCKLNVWDTAGLERTGSLTSHYYHSAHGIIFMYSVDDMTSLNVVVQWIEDADRYAKYATKFLVGNKSDLDQDDWEVEDSKATMFAETHNIAERFTVSAKSGEGVTGMFESVSRYLMEVVRPSIPNDDPFHLTEESLDLRKRNKNIDCYC